MYDTALDLNIRLTSMSLAGVADRVSDGNCGFTNGDVIHQLVCLLQQRGVLSVAAAGNSAGPIDFVFPAGYPEVLTVILFNDFDNRPGGLQFVTPPYCTVFDLDDGYNGVSSSDQSLYWVHRFHLTSAPGACINSTFPTVILFGPDNGTKNPIPYEILSGTSMSCPHASATAALCFSGYRCDPIPRTPQDMIEKFVSDGRRGSVPLSSIPTYDIANVFSGDVSPFSATRYYGISRSRSIPSCPRIFSLPPYVPLQHNKHLSCFHSYT